MAAGMEQGREPRAAAMLRQLQQIPPTSPRSRCPDVFLVVYTPLLSNLQGPRAMQTAAQVSSSLRAAACKLSPGRLASASRRVMSTRVYAQQASGSTSATTSAAAGGSKRRSLLGLSAAVLLGLSAPSM